MSWPGVSDLGPPPKVNGQDPSRRSARRLLFAACSTSAKLWTAQLHSLIPSFQRWGRVAMKQKKPLVCPLCCP
eukprot:6300938-Amphidinium_carterae.1